MKAEIPDRTYFKIGEVASILGVKPHIVRYWASEFPQIRLQKTKSGQRLFRRRDIDVLLAIDSLVNVQEYTVSGAKTRLKELRSIGVENKDLRDTIERIGSVDLMERIAISNDPQGLADQWRDTEASDTVALESSVREEHVREEHVREGRVREGKKSENQSEATTMQISWDAKMPETAQPAAVAWANERRELLNQQTANTSRIQELEDALKQSEDAHAELATARTNDAELHARIQELESTRAEERALHERREALLRESLSEERQLFTDEQKILTLYIEELEESLHQAKEDADERAREAAKALEQSLEEERTRHERRVALFQQSLAEERQFFADEQNIFTLYIESLEQSLYEERERSASLTEALDASSSTTEVFRRRVQTHAMKHRYALRKFARDARQHQDARAHVRDIAQRVRQRVDAQRLLTARENHNDSD